MAALAVQAERDVQTSATSGITEGPRSEAFPTAELNDDTRAYPGHEAVFDRTVSCFGAGPFGPSVKVLTGLAVGDAGANTGPNWLAPLIEALGGPVE